MRAATFGQGQAIACPRPTVQLGDVSALEVVDLGVNENVTVITDK